MSIVFRSTGINGRSLSGKITAMIQPIGNVGTGSYECAFKALPQAEKPFITVKYKSYG